MLRTLAALAISLTLAGLHASAAAAATDPGPAAAAAATRWVPAPATNYTAGRGGERVRLIVIHQTYGTYEGSIAWLRTASSRVSAHYVVRSRDGEITQMVREADTAWHVRGANRTSIGIEHEYYPRLGIGHADAQYRASASLVCEIARRHGLPVDRQHIVGHAEIPGTDHTDPGPAWNWAHFIALARAACGSAAASVAAAGTVASAAVLTAGQSGEEVRRLQRALTRLGYMNTVTGYFGPVTRAAVTRFQRDHGVAATGTFGPLTRAALTRLSPSW